MNANAMNRDAYLHSQTTGAFLGKYTNSEVGNAQLEVVWHECTA